MVLLHHIAIATVDYDQYKMLFEEIGMHLERETGSMPSRQLWFREGIQLKESRDVRKGSNVDHIALRTDCKEEILRIALKNGCTPDIHGNSWFSLSNGTIIELIETTGT